jgi:hypothetical protein
MACLRHGPILPDNERTRPKTAWDTPGRLALPVQRALSEPFRRRLRGHFPGQIEGHKIIDNLIDI